MEGDSPNGPSLGKKEDGGKGPSDMLGREKRHAGRYARSRGRPKRRNVQTRARARGAEGTGLLPARLRVSAARHPSTCDEAPRRRKAAAAPPNARIPQVLCILPPMSAPVSRGQGESRCIPAGRGPAGSSAAGWYAWVGLTHAQSYPNSHSQGQRAEEGAWSTPSRGGVAATGWARRPLHGAGTPGH